MPAKFYTQKPIEVFEYKKDDQGVKEELGKFGVIFAPDGSNVRGPGGNMFSIEDGDYIGLSADGSLRHYSKAYFEQNFVEHGQKPEPTKAPEGPGEPENPVKEGEEDTEGLKKQEQEKQAEKDKKSLDELNKNLRPEDKHLDQKTKPGEVPDQKAAMAQKK